MSKIAIVGFAILIATILVMLFIQFRPLQSGKVEQAGFSSNDLSGSAPPSRYDNAKLHHELLQQIKSLVLACGTPLWNHLFFSLPRGMTTVVTAARMGSPVRVLGADVSFLGFLLSLLDFC